VVQQKFARSSDGGACSATATTGLELSALLAAERCPKICSMFVEMRGKPAKKVLHQFLHWFAPSLQSQAQGADWHRLAETPLRGFGPARNEIQLAGQKPGSEWASSIEFVTPQRVWMDRDGYVKNNRRHDHPVRSRFIWTTAAGPSGRVAGSCDRRRQGSVFHDRGRSFKADFSVTASWPIRRKMRMSRHQCAK
jgi:hypothetical protein